jgi:polysaccharide biosynthesis protein PslH
MGVTVHAGNLMRSLVSLGHEVHLLSEQPVALDAQKWLGSVRCHDSMHFAGHQRPTPIGYLQRRSMNYWGVPVDGPAIVAAAEQQLQADAVVAVGVDSLPYLAGIRDATRVWYPADDPILLAYTLIRRDGLKLASLRYLATIMLYVRAFRRLQDVSWVVSDKDQKWLRGSGSVRQIDVIHNGVDAEYFQSFPTATPLPKSCIFWGNLSFAPNVHALEYFVESIWPRVVEKEPEARFHVCGSNGSSELVALLNKHESIVYHGELDDLRPQISRCRLGVFPMISGAGVKNKILESAAMQRPTLVSERCLGGLCNNPPPPFLVMDRPSDWVETMFKLWEDEPSARRLGEACRKWVLENHSWENSARAAIESIRRVSKKS